MRQALARVLRTDLIVRHWRSYLLVCVVALAVHAAWLGVFGIRSPTDFRVRYDPAARQLLAAIGASQFVDAPGLEIGTYAWSRIGYISFVAACYLAWGASLGAVVYSQIALAWLVYPLLFHVLLHVTGKHSLALWASLAWLSYADGYQWHFWALPDALYRCLFLAGFFLLLRLWETGRHTSFLVAAPVLVLIGTVVRIETPLYALPALWACSAILWRRQRAVVGVALMTGLAVAWMGRFRLADLTRIFVGLQTQGFVLPGSGTDIEGLTHIVVPTSQSVFDWMWFALRLMVMRFWYAITPLPALWSDAHRVYYALYVLPMYSLVAIGVAGAVRKRSLPFLASLWVFVGGVLLQTIISVDPSMRYGYTPQMFLFLCAAMSWPDVTALFAARTRSAMRQAGPRGVRNSVPD